MKPENVNPGNAASGNAGSCNAALANHIHQQVLAMEGVSTVFAADPLWLTAVKQLGTLLGPGAVQDVPFVVCSQESGQAVDAGAAQPTALVVRVRIGTDGSVPAPDMARGVAAGIRSLVEVQRPGLKVKAVVEIAAIGAPIR